MASTDTQKQDSKANILLRLEGILVEEFRTCRALQKLVKKERGILTVGDVDALSELIEDKEVLLDELSQIEEQRRMVIERLSEFYPDLPELPSTSALLTRLGPATSRRMNRLYTGIGTVIEQIRELNNGNQALALNGLNRVDAVQAYLLDIFQSPQSYQPPGVTPQMEQVLVWDVDQRT